MEKVLNTVSQSDALALGKAYWENEFKKLLAIRNKAIAGMMRDMAGMDSKAVLEDFATLQVDGFIRGYRLWIDETFKD